MIITLEHALSVGRGVERPFQCPSHDDRSASASVNVLKGVWYCHACFASGRVDGNRVPTMEELEAMLEPEKAVRRYPESWLALFGVGGYWLDRFPEWLCWYAGFGGDPWSGEGTYPVRTPSGVLAGVCRRAVVDDGPKYRYPRGWSMSHALGYPNRSVKLGADHSKVLVLVEGYADAAALWEAGINAAPVFGSGLHLPQLDSPALRRAQLVVSGYDADEAGMLAAERTEEALPEMAHAWVDWSEYDGKDPAELDVSDRRLAVAESVAGAGYGRAVSLLQQWHVAAGAIKQAYVEEASAA